MHTKPAYAPIDESMAPGGHVYPPPPDSADMHHPHSSPLAASTGFHHLSTVNELPEVIPALSPGNGKAIPETTAPLLHFAIASGQIDTLRLLLARPNINLNGRDNSGYTPLQRAVCDGRTDMAALLLERGAIVEGAEEWMQMHQESAKEHQHQQSNRL